MLPAIGNIGPRQLTRSERMKYKNFLPKFAAIQTISRTNKLRCLIRGKPVTATPEEEVRQRVLHWLINKKKWDKSSLKLEKSYKWVSDPGRHRIRSDIELRNNQGQTVVVVECKNSKVPLTKKVEQQAIEYAIKSGAEYIWVTNGDMNEFLKRSDDSTWESINSLEPLGIISNPPSRNLNFPDPTNESEVDLYFMNYPKAEGINQFKDFGKGAARRFTLAVHKVLFDMKMKLPYSYEGVHILENKGTAFRKFSNAGGGYYHTLYSDFLAATEGRVEAMSIAVNRLRNGADRLRLCVGASKSNRVHHALQLDYAKCVWNESKECWHICHNGRMANGKGSGISIDTVFEAVRESGVGHWIVADFDNKKMISLGDLYVAESATSKNSKELLANLLHYGIIRTNLRDACQARKK